MSMKLTPAAATWTRTWPGPATGSACSASTNASGPPSSRTTIARTRSRPFARLPPSTTYHASREPRGPVWARCPVQDRAGGGSLTAGQPDPEAFVSVMPGIAGCVGVTFPVMAELPDGAGTGRRVAVVTGGAGAIGGAVAAALSAAGHAVALLAPAAPPPAGPA